ncbi:hypothetical protein SteCoe_13657 [Stentor coeruleus]|uniref:Uncharacterized protein n=1 Tax=Stentor coeruleus TaxID=5963 RepID=A0A1R2C7T4_9CILI|nr:hypothetical protein SteCoe_13657 [Stentor coeruleus]
MEDILTLFLKDKTEFFKSISIGHIDINTLTIGLTLSYNSPNPFILSYLLAALEKIMRKTQDDSTKSLCLIKFFQTLSRYLYSSTNYEPHLCEQFVYFAEFLSNMQFRGSNPQVIYHNFSQTYRNLFKIFARSDYMYDLYIAVYKNVEILKDKEKVFNSKMQENIEKIHKAMDVGDCKGFLIGIEGFFEAGAILKIQEIEDLIEFVAWKVRKNAKKVMEEGLEDWLFKVVDKYYMIFTENTRLELDALLRISERVREKNCEKIEMKKEEKVDREDLKEENEHKTIMKGKICGIKIVEKPYTDSDIEGNSGMVAEEEKKEQVFDEKKKENKRKNSYEKSVGGEYEKQPKNESDYIKKYNDSDDILYNLPGKNSLISEEVKKDNLHGKISIKIPQKIYDEDSLSDSGIEKKNLSEQSPQNSEDHMKKVITSIITSNKQFWEKNEQLNVSDMTTKFTELQSESSNFSRSLYYIVRNMIDKDDLNKSRTFWKTILRTFSGFLQDHNIKIIKETLYEIPSVPQEDYKYSNYPRNRNQGRNLYRNHDKNNRNHKYS